MSIDEMRTHLQSIGEKIETQASTSQFMEPLIQLAAYYEHQKEMLKGFEKFSEKQKENLQIIDGWIREVKALIETLNG